MDLLRDYEMSENKAVKAESELGINREGSTARTETPSRRVLPADVYDTLELSALMWGGIGRGQYFQHEADYGQAGEVVSPPVCIIGHARFADRAWGEVETVMRGAHFDGIMNDRAVRTINARKGLRSNSRVPFGEWCEELGVVRGS